MKLIVLNAWLYKIIESIFVFIKKITTALKEIFTPRLLTVFGFTIISVWLFLPLPYQKIDMFFWGYQQNGINPNFSELIRFKNNFSKIFVNSVEFPSQVKYYDAHFENLSKHHDNYDLLFRIQFRDGSLFWNYAKDFFGEPEYKDTSDYDIMEGQKVTVQAIPLDVPITYSSVPMCSATGGSCPEDDKLWFMSQDKKILENPKEMRVYVTPNFISWAIQALLIFAYWAVLINSLTELVKRK